MGLAIHVVLFAFAALAITVMSAFYADPDDRRALASIPRRFLAFLLGSAVVVALMLACERLFASVS